MPDRVHYHSRLIYSPAGQFRQTDHRFEWTRHEFQEWAQQITQQFGYAVRFLSVEPEHESLGLPTQIGVFERV